MIEGTEFSSIPGFPEFFNNFLKNDNFITDIFSDFSLNISHSYIELSQSEDNLFTIIKPFFAGGTLSNYFKILSLISYLKCNKIGKLIIDDLCIDNMQLSGVKLLDENMDTVEMHFPSDSTKENRKLIKYRDCPADSIDQIENIISILSGFKHYNDIKLKLFEIYEPGKTIIYAFKNYLQYLFENENIDYIYLSELLNSEIVDFFITDELNNPGKFTDIVSQSFSYISKKGLNINPKTSIYNLEYIRDNELLKFTADINSLDKLIPAVMLKTFLIDILLPGKKICSPSEIGEEILLYPLFEHFGFNPPTLIPRYSATILPSDIINNLKKKHQDNLIFNLIFPDGMLQERHTSILYFIAAVGIEKFIKITSELINYNPDKHYSIRI